MSSSVGDSCGRTRLGPAVGQLGAQALLEERHGDDEHHGETQRDEDHARV